MKYGHAMSKQKLVEGFPDDKTLEVSKAISHLQELGYVTIDLTSNNCVVSIPTFMVEDVLRIVNPDKIIFQSETPRKNSSQRATVTNQS